MPGARRLWPLIREQVAATAGAEHDERRLHERARPAAREVGAVLLVGVGAVGPAARRAVRRPPSTSMRCSACSIPRLIVGDLGCGTGQLTELVAPHVARVIAVDSSADMLQAARRRSPTWRTWTFATARSKALPIDDGAARRSRCWRWCCITSRIPRARWPNARACSSPAGGCWSSTCCRTIATSTSSRWATSGSDFPRSRCTSCWPPPASAASASARCPIDPEAKGPALFAAVGTKRAA